VAINGLNVVESQNVSLPYVLIVIVLCGTWRKMANNNNNKPPLTEEEESEIREEAQTAAQALIGIFKELAEKQDALERRVEALEKQIMNMKQEKENKGE
jgi:flagellar biosynthesis/type III secretory pathway M-ring protein FliF/YscJ